MANAILRCFSLYFAQTYRFHGQYRKYRVRFFNQTNRFMDERGKIKWLVMKENLVTIYFLAKIIMAIVWLIVNGFIYFNSIDFYSFCWFSLVCWVFLSLQAGIGFILIEMTMCLEEDWLYKQSNRSILFFFFIFKHISIDMEQNAAVR